MSFPIAGSNLVHDAQEAFKLAGVRGQNLVGSEALTGGQVFSGQVAGTGIQDGRLRRVQ